MLGKCNKQKYAGEVEFVIFLEDVDDSMEVIYIPNKNYIVVCNPKLGLLFAASHYRKNSVTVLV